MSNLVASENVIKFCTGHNLWIYENDRSRLTALVFNEEFWIALGMIIHNKFTEQQSPS